MKSLFSRAAALISRGTKPGRLRVPLLVALLAGVAGFVIHLMDWDDHLYYLYFSNFDSKATLSLNGYEFKKRIELPDVENLSGVIYNEDRGTLSLIMNSPETLLECDLEGNIMERHSLDGFDDTEGICFDDAGNLVVIEEKKQSLIILPEPGGNGIISRDDSSEIIELILYPEDNKQFEGLAYSNQHRSFFIAKEKNPPAVFQMVRSDSSLSVRRLFSIRARKLHIEDISDIFCRANGNLLILSDESATVSECNLDGDVVSYLQLDGGFNGLAERIPQAEGLCMDEEENLYIVSEPNLLYIYQPPAD